MVPGDDVSSHGDRSGGVGAEEEGLVALAGRLKGDPNGRLRGKVALVTGAASGIGHACVERFVRDGAMVVGIDVATPRPIDVSAADAVAFAPCDVRDEDAVRGVVAAIVREHGRIDAVVNAAGVAGGGPVHMLAESEWHRVIDINLTGTYLIAKHVIEQMLRQSPVAGER